VDRTTTWAGSLAKWERSSKLLADWAAEDDDTISWTSRFKFIWRAKHKKTREHITAYVFGEQKRLIGQSDLEERWKGLRPNHSVTACGESRTGDMKAAKIKWFVIDVGSLSGNVYLAASSHELPANKQLQKKMIAHVNHWQVERFSLGLDIRAII
jgi:hypothetical protein